MGERDMKVRKDRKRKAPLGRADTLSYKKKTKRKKRSYMREKCGEAIVG